VKYYEQLLQWRCFTNSDVARLTGNKSTADSLISAYKKKGLIESIHKDLFAAISLETRQPAASRFNIATKVAPDAVISHHSAFEFYGVSDNCCFEMYSATSTRFRPFEYRGISYLPVPRGIESGIEEQMGGVRVTDLERTALDSINDFERIGDLGEVVRCLKLIPSLKAEKLLSYLPEYHSGYLYQKVGYILSQCKELYLPDKFFDICRANIPVSKRYLYKGLQMHKHVFSEEWRLYVPPSLADMAWGIHEGIPNDGR
jgi:predicted transcriptional regulator of viral defense system